MLDLVAAAGTNRHIARHLAISVKTAAKHVEHLMEKTGCQSRTAAAVLAVEDGVRLLQTPGSPEMFRPPAKADSQELGGRSAPSRTRVIRDQGPLKFIEERLTKAPLLRSTSWP